jgi:squalene synthase HpnC
VNSSKDGDVQRIETPSGKDAAYENFPVGSFLLPKHARPHVAVFYAYARAIDDIADNPALLAVEKIERLEGFAAAIKGENLNDPAYETGHRMRRSLVVTGVPEKHCLDLIDAFRQDAVQSRYEDWPALMNYCDRSAAPVGRFLVDVTGGSKDGYATSDALCRALQVINHLQDVKDDYQKMDRVYLPQAWMRMHGCTEGMLLNENTVPELRHVIDQCLSEVALLIDHAKPIRQSVKSRRLAMEATAIVKIAESLCAKLQRDDPLKDRITLSKSEYMKCIYTGAIQGLFA